MVAGEVGDASGAKPGHVMELIKQFDFLSFSVGGKIHCSLTNRDLPLRVDAINQHVNSKKLRKEREWIEKCDADDVVLLDSQGQEILARRDSLPRQASGRRFKKRLASIKLPMYKADYSKYEPFIMPHKTKPKMLYCTLTGTELNRIPKQVEAHVNGKRFRSRKAEFERGELSKREAQGEELTAEEGSDEHDFWAPSGKRDAGKDEDVRLSIDRMSESDDDDDDGDAEEEDKAEEIERLPSRTSKKSRNQNGGVQRRNGGGHTGAAEKKKKGDSTRKTGKTDAGVTASGVGPAGGEKPGAKPGKKRGKHRVGASGPGVERCPEAKGMPVARKKGKGRSASSSLGVVGPLSDETPAVSNAMKTVPAPAMAPASTQRNDKNKKKETKNGEAAPHVKVKKEMVRNKANKGKGDKGTIESATGNGAAPQGRRKSKPNGGMTPPSTASSSNKRQHRLPDGQASGGKKKRLV